MARRDEDGRFRADPWQHRVLEWAQLARGVAPSTINRNISEVLTLFASEEVVPLACERQMRKLRTEVTIAGEMIAALRVALCTRIISFGFDESTKFGLGLLSTNTQIEPHDAPGTSIDVVMRGVTLTTGGTAKEIAADIDEKLFTHARRLLTLWKAEHERMHAEGSWEKAGMPAADNVGLHRLSENAVLMSDTCNAARATKRLVAEMAEEAGRVRIGTEAWEKMSEAEREEAVKCHLGDCHDHLRNIIIKAMSTEATNYLQGLLADSLDVFSAFDRMSVDGMDLIRAACKELHPNGAYALGKGREAMATRVRDHPSDLWLPIYNADGSRMDAAFDGSPPLYMNRLLILEFLHPLVHGPAAKDNLLEKFLWRVLSCNEMIALLRVNTLWQMLVTEPLRWLTGKASKALSDWSMVNSNKLLDKTYDLMATVAADGSKLFDPQLDPFAEVAASQPKFAEHRRKQLLEEIKAPDGTLYLSHIRTLEVARSPATEATTPIAVELAQRMANAALVAMRDRKRAIADKLSSQEGANSANAAKSARVHEKTMGAHVMNAHVESHFGKADNCMRTYRNATAENIAGMVQQAYNQDFDQPLNVASDRRKRKSDAPEPSVGGGFFWCNKLMTDELRSSLVSAVRKESESARIEGRKALAAHDTAKLKRREERLATALDAAVDYYAYSKELFEAWSDAEEHGGESQGITTLVALDAALKDQSEAKQLEILRFQIDMRTIALGWDQFKTKWSSKSDATIGTVKHLRSLLLDIIAHETAERRLKHLPTEASPPQFTAKDLGQLGSACADALAIQQKAIFSVEELARKAEQAMARREAAGISDSVERLQPKAAPPFDQQLVGKWLEVLCWYNLPDGTRQLLWAPGRVARVADGVTDTRTKRGKALMPAGAVLWAWDADPDFGEVAGEKWLILLPNKWNPTTATVNGWRYDPRELSSAPVRDDARRRGGTRMDE